MTEPEAGSDLRGMSTRAVRDGDDWVINGTKHFISHADVADFVILFAATGAGGAAAGPAGEITAFLVDVGTPGLAVLPGYRSVSHRGYDNCRARLRRLPGAGRQRSSARSAGLRGGQHLARRDPAAGRRHLPRPGPARAGPRRRARRQPPPVRPADRPQPGRGVQARRHGDRAGVGDVADLAGGLAGRPAGPRTDPDDRAMAKLYATEMLAMVADEAIQIYGGMGLMDELALERIWRDARVERIWDGTSEIQRHIISRSMLRAPVAEALSNAATCDLCCCGRADRGAAAARGQCRAGGRAELRGRWASPGAIWPVHPTTATVAGSGPIARRRAARARPTRPSSPSTAPGRAPGSARARRARAAAGRSVYSAGFAEAGGVASSAAGAT